MFLFQFHTKILSLHRQKISENQEKLIMFFPYSLHMRHPKLTRDIYNCRIIDKYVLLNCHCFLITLPTNSRSKELHVKVSAIEIKSETFSPL